MHKREPVYKDRTAGDRRRRPEGADQGDAAQEAEGAGGSAGVRQGRA